jgi:hypothetical protein
MVASAQQAIRIKNYVLPTRNELIEKRFDDILRG